MRPDPTPPDDSLFPIAPCYTAELDATALDQIAAAVRFADLKTRTIDGEERYAVTRKTFDRIRAAILSTGREV